jgi:hypothetical protein
MRLHRTDNLRLIAQFAITTISRRNRRSARLYGEET